MGGRARPRTRPRALALTACGGLLLAPLALTAPASAHPEQHGTPDGHLTGSGAWGDLEPVGRADLTDVDDIVADVAVDPSGRYAYLAHWGKADCAANSEAGGVTDPDAGVFVVDMTDLSEPRRIGFIPHSQDSRPGEGVQALDVSTKHFNGTMLVTNNEQCGKNGKGGVTLHDVTNPAKPVRLSSHFGDRGGADTNDTHSAFAWDAGDRAYVVMTDNFENADVDILDITNPRRPRLIAELDLNALSAAAGDPIAQPELGLSESSLHDMVVKQVDGRWTMLLSYWDGGYVQMDVTDPTRPQLLGDTDFTDPDPELLESTGMALPPEGNAHQAEYTADDRFFIGTDEDFSPYRSDFTIDTGPHAGTYPAGEFGFTPPVLGLPDQELNGPVVYGGYGCPGDRAGIPTRSTALPGPLAPGEEAIVVFQRGPVDDPSASGGACFFSEKIESGQLAGYDAVVVANHHSGAQGGAAPDAQFCGGQGHEYVKTAPAVCIGHRAMHLLFADTPSYELPYAGSEPPLGAVGERVSFTPSFDGWGYVHLFDRDGVELDTYAVREAHDESFASGFGDLSVHEVATHPVGSTDAYLSYYSAGMRSLEIQCSDPADTATCELVETGGFLAEEGNDFWGVEAFVRDGQTYVLGSDRDDGLWVFRDTHTHP